MAAPATIRAAQPVQHAIATNFRVSVICRRLPTSEGPAEASTDQTG